MNNSNKNKNLNKYCIKHYKGSESGNTIISHSVVTAVNAVLCSLIVAALGFCQHNNNNIKRQSTVYTESECLLAKAHHLIF